MTDYIPGRIYSGIYLSTDRRITVMRGTGDEGSDFTWTDGETYYDEGELIDVRGPLVVLDMHDFTASTVRDLTGPLRDAGWNGIADQIEAQTRPPLQVGWHECHLDNALPRVLWWDGERFLHAPHGSWVDKWRSVAYLGKGTRA